MRQQEFIELNEPRIAILGANSNQRQKIEHDLVRIFNIRTRPIEVGEHNCEHVVRGLREPLLIVHEGNMNDILCVMLHLGRQ